jgi:hypothetical protein
MTMGQRVDISSILPAIHVPTLVLHRTGDPSIEVERGRELAARITGARYVELPGSDHYFWAGDADLILSEMQEFLTGVRPAPEDDRVLATVLVTRHRWVDRTRSHDRGPRVGLAPRGASGDRAQADRAVSRARDRHRR